MWETHFFNYCRVIYETEAFFSVLHVFHWTMKSLYCGVKWHWAEHSFMRYDNNAIYYCLMISVLLWLGADFLACGTNVLYKESSVLSWNADKLFLYYLQWKTTFHWFPWNKNQKDWVSGTFWGWVICIFFFFLLKSRMIKLKFTSSNLLVPWLEIFSLESYCNNSKQNMNPT